MQLITALWVVNLFFFAVILFFIWSKTSIIAKKAKALPALISSIEAMQHEAPPSGSPSPKKA